MSMSNTQTETKPSNRALFNAEEIASMTGMSRGFVYGAISRGELPSVRLGRAVRVRAMDLEAWIERNLIKAVA